MTLICYIDSATVPHLVVKELNSLGITVESKANIPPYADFGIFFDEERYKLACGGFAKNCYISELYSQVKKVVYFVRQQKDLTLIDLADLLCLRPNDTLLYLNLQDAAGNLTPRGAGVITLALREANRAKGGDL